MRVEAIAAVGFVLASLGLAVAQGGQPLPVGQTAALVATYLVLARIRFAVGSGFTMPTQLALVPMLLLLPPALVPALVGTALVLARAPELIGRKAPAERLLSSIADGWYVVPPAVLLAFVAPGGAIEDAGWGIWIAALALQLVGDLVASTLRESLGAGVSPTLHARVVVQIAIVDVLLSGVGLMAALGSQIHHYAFLLTVPLAAGLDLFARDRSARIARALELVDDLDRERQRVIAAHRRIGETAAANLDRPALERIIVETAVELVEVDAGWLSARDACSRSRPEDPWTVCGDLGDLEALVAAVDSSLTAHDGLVETSVAAATAIGVSLECGGEHPRVLAVARRGRGFVARERELLRTLAEQASICLQNLALHERVERLAATDELTGLLNHRRLQEVLEREVRVASRYDGDLALVMLDVDDFKLVNDQHGHQQGDRLLRAVADVVRGSVRDVDFVARYGGEELAVVLPQLDLDGAAVFAERIRNAIAATVVPVADDRGLSVTASLGLATLAGGVSTRQDLIAAADSALYGAKRAGKNRVEVYRPGDRDRGALALASDGSLRVS
jgi:diguanylate cyclase (GGDEF)-like protein